jgi:hypothetical protein
MRVLIVPLVALVSCGGRSPMAAPPSNTTAAHPPSLLATVNWMDREYSLFERSFAFHGGRYADSELVLQIAPPLYLDVTGDGAVEALLPLQIDEAETAVEQGNPRFHSFIVHTVEHGAVVQLGELPMMTCGPLRIDVAGAWLRVTSTRRGRPDDMCGRLEHTRRYRWNGTWFVNDDGDEVERRLL